MSLAFWNRQWLPADEVHIALNDLGLTMGVSVVERLRTFAGRPFRVEQHAARLRRSLQTMGWPADQLTAEVTTAIEDFPVRNKAFFEPGDDWAIVAFVTPGASLDAATPNVCVHGFPLPFSGWAHQFADGLQTVVVDVRQTPADCWPAELKCRSRMHYYLADQQANEKIAGARAILLDRRGFIAEASTANVAAYYPDRGLVRPGAGNVLPGVSQEVLAELAKELGIPLSEDDLRPEEFARAQEGLLLSTSVCVLPIVGVDSLPLGIGQPGPIYEQLLEAWSQLVGLDIAAQARQFATRPH